MGLISRLFKRNINNEACSKNKNSRENKKQTHQKSNKSSEIQNGKKEKITTKQELIEWSKTLKGYNVPNFYVEMTDSGYNRQVKVNGKWVNVQDAWGVFQINGKWRYVETEVERGYVTYHEEFKTEEKACEEIVERFKGSMQPRDPHEYYKQAAMEKLIYKFGYEKTEAEEIVNKFNNNRGLQSDLCECLMLEWDLDPRRASRVEIDGYSAERLVSEYKMSELEAFEFLLKLSENRKKALKELAKRNHDSCSENKESHENMHDTMELKE